MKNRNLLLSFLGILIVILILIGISYAYYSAKIKENNKTETVLKSNELNLIFTGTKEITANNMIPGDRFTKTFTVENTSNRAVDYNIYLQNITNEFNEDLVYTLEDTTGSVIGETPLPVTNKDKSYLKKGISIEANTIKTYTLKITFKNTDEPQNDYQGKTFKGTLGIDTKQLKEEHGIKLYSILADNADTTTKLNFSKRSGDSSILTNGIYMTTETEGNKQVYFYRGKVNNNIIFNNMCWKIIRTTETNGTKLIYNGVPTNGKCDATGSSTQIGNSVFNSDYKDNAYVGYMYGISGSDTYSKTHENINDSTIKKYIENWFSTNFTSDEITNKIEDTVYCNDRSLKQYDISEWDWDTKAFKTITYGAIGYGTNATGYGAIARASYNSTNPSPNLKCLNEEDKFTTKEENGNGKLKNPIGLITLDETLLAGFNVFEANKEDYHDTNNYLYTGQEFWTMSPVYVSTSGSAYIGYIYSSGSISSDYAGYEHGVRPVISLNNNTLVENEGNGTIENPYVVK